MTAILVASLMLPFCIGYCLISLSWPRLGGAWEHLLLKASLSAGIGLGISSGIYFIGLLLFGPSRIVLLVEMLVLISLAAFYWNKTKVRFYSPSPVPDIFTISHPPCHWTLPLSFAIVFLTSMILLSLYIIHNPHGMPDAWGVWNLRARFIFRSGEYWANAFSSVLHWAHHTDYPLLIPCIVARFWQVLGHETQVVPALLSMSFTILTIFLMVSSLSILRGKSQAYLSGLVLASFGLFIHDGDNQCADIPVGFFYLATMVLLFIQERLPKNYNLSLLAGLTASLSGWTKNEGLLFLAAIAIARFAVAVKSEEIKNRLVQLLYFAIGTIPVMSIIIYFKVQLVPPNDLLQSLDHGHLIPRLIDLTAHVQIIKALVNHFLYYSYSLIMLAVCIACFGIKVGEVDKNGIVTSLLTLSIMFCGFYFVYLTTPHDLTWHLKTSLERVLLQLWPTFIFTYFLMVRSPEEVMVPKENRYD